MRSRAKLRLVGEEPEITAAGGLVVRERDGTAEVAVVHRPRYDDWSLPKGKLKPGESWERGALREVEEETGFACELVGEVQSATYTDQKGRTKLVRFWRMRPVSGEFSPGDEVDELRWLTPDTALEILSYEHDRRLVSCV